MGINVVELLACIFNGRDSVILLRFILILFYDNKVVKISHTSRNYSYFGAYTLPLMFL